MGSSVWQQNMVDMIQTIFMVVGFYITAKTFIDQILTRKAEFRMRIDDKYQNIKNTAIENPQLARVFKHLSNKKITITAIEEAYVKQLINHVHMVYDIWILKQIELSDGMRKDISGWLSCTIPGMVWKEKKSYYDKGFVRFMEELL